MPQVNALPIEMHQASDIKGNLPSSQEGYQAGSQPKENSFSKLVDKHMDTDSGGNAAVKRQENSGKYGSSEDSASNLKGHDCGQTSTKKRQESDTNAQGKYVETSTNSTGENSAKSIADESAEHQIAHQQGAAKTNAESSTDDLAESSQFIAMLNSSEKLLNDNKTSAAEELKLVKSLEVQSQAKENATNSVHGSKPSIEFLSKLTDAEKLNFSNPNPIGKRFSDLDQLHSGSASTRKNLDEAESIGDNTNVGGKKIHIDEGLASKKEMLSEEAKTKAIADNVLKQGNAATSQQVLNQNSNGKTNNLTTNASESSTGNSADNVALTGTKANSENVDKQNAEQSKLNAENLNAKNSAVVRSSTNTGTEKSFDGETTFPKENSPIASIIAQAIKKEKYDHKIQPVIDGPASQSKTLELANGALAELQGLEAKNNLANNANQHTSQPVNQSTQSLVKASVDQSNMSDAGKENSPELQASENVNESSSEVKLDKLTIDRIIEQNIRTASANAPLQASMGTMSPLNALGESKLSAEYIANVEAITNQASIQKSVEQKQSIALTQETISIYRKDFASAVKDKVMMMVNQKLQQVEIRLDPPELGNVHVRVNLQNEQAAVSFVVQNQQAKEALEQNTDKLREMLAQSGVEVGDTNVSQQDQQSTEDENSNANGGLLSQREQEMADDIHHVIENRLFKASANGVDYYA